MKIIFFINSLQQQRCYKRIREFISKGYEIEAYGFEREGSKVPIVKGIEPISLGFISAQMSNAQRLLIMRQAIKPIALRHKHNKDCIFYYFLLDVAMAGYSVSRHPFIYEESDLSQAYIKNKIIRTTLDIIDRHIIKKSILTIFTSSGFLKYHYNGEQKENTIVVPNKLDKRILQFTYNSQPIDYNRIKFGYVGHIRHKSTIRFATIIAQYFPKHEVHLYGTVRPEINIEELKQYNNIYIHGCFTNPDDLPQIYENIDLLLAPEYDEYEENGKYAEPNKLYDAIYFRKPIITNPYTHTAEIIAEQNIGFAIKFDNIHIKQFVETLSKEIIDDKLTSLKQISQQNAINDNPQLFNILNRLIINK